MKLRERLARSLRWLGWPAALAGVLAVAAVGIAWFILDERVSNEQYLAAYLADEIGKLDREIGEIRKIREEVASLTAHARAAERISARRGLAVRVLDDLARQRPDGVRLELARQEGSLVEVAGRARSYLDVAALLDNLDRSQVMERPELVEVKSGAAGDRSPAYPLSFTARARVRGIGDVQTPAVSSAPERTGKPKDPA